MITATQCRMARSALRWKLEKTVEESNISRTTLYSFENGRTNLKPVLRKVLQRAFESAGVEFINGAVKPPESGKE